MTIPWRWGMVGLVVGAVLVWALTSTWINREHTRAVHWVDSTGAAHQAKLAVLDRQRIAAVELASHLRVARGGGTIARAKREAVGSGPNVRAGSYGMAWLLN